MPENTYTSFFKTSLIDTIRNKVFDTFNWAYERAPINFAHFTGCYHPSVSRLKGNALLGSTLTVGIYDGNGIASIIENLGKLADKDPRGMAYCTFPTLPSLLITRSTEIAQALIFNSDKIDRGSVLRAFVDMYGYHNLTTIPSNTEWKNKRAHLQEWVYSERALKDLASPMQNIIDEYIARLEANNIVPSLEKFAVELTMDVIARTLLNSQPLGENAHALSDAFGLTLDAAGSPLNGILSDIAKTKLAACLDYFNVKINKNLLDKRNLLNKTLEEHFLKPNLDKFLKDSKCIYELDEEKDCEQRLKIMDDINLLLLAGHETTARLIQFTLVLLCKNPSILKELREEIHRNRPANNKWTREHLGKMDLLGKILKETLRLLPPFPVMPRSVIKKLILADIPLCKNKEEYEREMAKRDKTKDVILHPGESLNISAWINQRSERYYKNALEYNPYRHESGKDIFKSAPLNRTHLEDDVVAFLAFGLGDRDCPGKRFALQEGGLTIINLVDRFDFKAETSLDKLADITETYIRGTLKPKNEVHVTFTPR